MHRYNLMMNASNSSLVVYLSPDGHDDYSGFLEETRPDGTDGPLATLEAAVTRIPELRRSLRHCGTITIRVRAGRYPLHKPLVFGSEHSGVSVEAYPGEQPVMEGAEAVRSWRETEVNDRLAWVADVSGRIRQTGPFRSLWVNARRARRARWPAEGWLAMKSVPGMPEEAGLFHPCDCIESSPGDLPAQIKNPGDAEVIIPHFWIQERLPLENIDHERNLIHTARASIFRCTDDFSGGPGKRYCIENLMEGLLNPGDWYLDTRKGLLYYLPTKEDSLETTEILIPTVYQFIRAHTDLESGERIEELSFSGLTFRYSDWCPPEGAAVWYDPYEPKERWRKRDSLQRFAKQIGPLPDESWQRRTVCPQSDVNVPGTISFRGTTRCEIIDCRISETGYYGIDLGEACTGNRIEGNTLESLGGGGIKADGSGPDGDPALRTTGNVISDNTIGHMGKVFAAGVGIITLFSADNRIEHNHVHHTQYSGISVGWTWGFGATVSGGNFIGHNLVEHIGVGLLSDMAGIYLLGCQPGTFVRGNVVRHVAKYSYGGNGIYPDEGSSFMVIEDNLVERVGSHGFNEHWGRQNIIRNNVFAFANGGCVHFARERGNGWVAWPDPGAFFEHNICISEGEAFFGDPMTYLDTGILRSSQNLYIQAGGKDGILWHYEPWPQYGKASRPVSLSELQDIHVLETGSIETRERVFADPQNGDYSFVHDGLLRKIGFKPVDWTVAGPRPREERGIFQPLPIHGVGKIYFGD